MANNQPPQYFTNDLQPIKIDEASLELVLADLRAAVRRGIDLVQANYQTPAVTENEEVFGTIAYGALGMFV
jgi:hypothetical protein